MPDDDDNARSAVAGFVGEAAVLSRNNRTARVPDDGCGPFALNSREWLDGPRIGNIDISGGDGFGDDGLGGTTNYFTMTTTQPKDRASLSSPSSAQIAIQRLLGQSICHETSPFVNRLLGDRHEHASSTLSQPSQEASAATEATLTTALVYLSLHAFQHRPAVPEVQLRRELQRGEFHRASNSSASTTDNENCQHYYKGDIGSFDYECPTAKFLVVRLFQNGIGANMRLGAVPAYFAGLATNRVVLFVNNLSGPRGVDGGGTDDEYLRAPWKLASCGRRDYQCFFMPSSPCVLTHQELANAYTLQKQETRRIFRTGTLPEEHDDKRVVVLRLVFRPQRQPPTLRPVLHALALSVVDQLAPQYKGVDGSESSLRRTLIAAANRILQEDKAPLETKNYYGANSPVFHGVLLYAMRPNPQSRSDVDKIIKDVLPSNFDSEQSIGLPIRGE